MIRILELFKTNKVIVRDLEYIIFKILHYFQVPDENVVKSVILIMLTALYKRLFTSCLIHSIEVWMGK